MSPSPAKRFAIGSLLAAAMLTTFASGARAATSSTTSLQLLSSSTQFQYLVQSVPLSVTVTGSPTGTTPGGTVTFYDESGAIGSTSTLTTISGLTYIVRGSFSTNALPVGSHTIHGVYSGDSHYSGSTTGTQAISIVPGTTQTSLSVNPGSGPYTPGERLTLSATVTSPQLSASSLSGTVTFTDGGAVLGTVPISGSNVNLAASLTSVGTHQLAAAYSGTSNITGSLGTASLVIGSGVVATPPPTSAPPSGTTSQPSGGSAPAPVASRATAPAATAAAPSTTPAPANRPLGSAQGASLPATVFDKAVVPPIEALELGAASGIAFGKAVLLTPFLIPLNIIGLLWLASAWRKGRKLSRIALVGRAQAAHPTPYEGSGVSTARQQYHAATER